jgi:hypothetical protein
MPNSGEEALLAVLLQPLPPHHHQVPHQPHLVSREILPYRYCTVQCCLLYCCSHYLLTTIRFPTRLQRFSQLDETQRCHIMFLKVFVKKVFQLVKPYLANLRSTSSKNTQKCTQWLQIFFYFFLAYGYQNYAEFYAGFKSLGIIKKGHPEKVICQKTFAS